MAARPRPALPSVRDPAQIPLAGDDLAVTGEVFFWRGPFPYHSCGCRRRRPRSCGRWPGRSPTAGTIPVELELGDTVWETSLWPKDGGYLVPLKDRVRHAEGVDQGDVATLRLTVRPHAEHWSGDRPQTPAADRADGPVTVAITRRVRPEDERLMQAWVDAGTGMAARFPGFLGAGWVRPSTGSREWHMLYRFDSRHSLLLWEESRERTQWLRIAADLVGAHQGRAPHRHRGLVRRAADPLGGGVCARSPRRGGSRPSRSGSRSSR